jgi:hypothetical protein
MRKSAKIITALSVAGLAIAAGSAFTGGGLTNAAETSKFVGGSVTQGITGATLSNVVYTFQDAPTNRVIGSAQLTFAADSVGKNVAISFTAASGAAYTCTTVAAVTFNSDCTPVGALATDVTSATISVTTAS